AIGALNLLEPHPQGARAQFRRGESGSPADAANLERARRGSAHPWAIDRNASARCLSFSARARSAESSSDSENRRSASESSSLRAPASRSSGGTASSTRTRAVLE